MRFLIALTLLGVMALAAVLHWEFQLGQTPSNSESAKSTSSASLDLSSESRSSISSAALANAITNTLTIAQKETAIEAEETRLQQLGVNDDEASYAAILTDLTNSEQKVRLAAIEALKQFGNRDAIPALKAAAAKTADQDEQIALMKAADFLALPTIAEVHGQLHRNLGQFQEVHPAQPQSEVPAQVSNPANP